MNSITNPTIRLLESDPEVKSFIYQQIVDFEPYVTPDTVVAVVARDPRKLQIQLETEGRDVAPSELRKMHRIAIVLTEGDTSIEEEGLHENLYDAIRSAKTSLLNKLSEIQDSVVSNSERVDQINQALANTQLH
jgi:hypothetical protein